MAEPCFAWTAGTHANLHTRSRKQFQFDRKDRGAGAGGQRYFRVDTEIDRGTPMTRTLEKPRTAKAKLHRDDRRWAAVMARDKAAAFYYSVATTGVYCRPSCAARRPKRSNVAFHETRDEAEGAGFRPCKRCRPDQASLDERYAGKVATACRLIETADEPPRLGELAKSAGLSPYHFHRVFKAIAGVTPKAYAVAHRQKRVRDKLKRSRSVTEAIQEAGFNSSGRFYASSAQVLGMTPTAFRAGGRNTEMKFAIGVCSLGSILVSASPKGVSAILIGDDPDELVRDLEDRFPRARLIGGDRDFERLVAKVIGFVEAPRTGLDLPLDVQGTAFQHRVWKALCEIPVGSTATYTEIAKRIGRPKAVRAVAGACAANRLAVAIPCHRVVRTDGALSGYRWGVERKRALLHREAKS
jgi:AraC family transcriptional regulator of adaptative response/methylated-DNA-[protein]-cysteine methyltransferase